MNIARIHQINPQTPWLCACARSYGARFAYLPICKKQTKSRKGLFLGVYLEKFSGVVISLHQIGAFLFAGSNSESNSRSSSTQGRGPGTARGLTIGRIIFTVTLADIAKLSPLLATISTLKVRPPRGASRITILVDLVSSKSSPSM